MDLLENYKKAWDNQPEENSKFSALEIYKMAHSKSSSIVKWIFIIGIIEFLFWVGINFTIPEEFYKIYKDLNLLTFLNVFTVLHYIIILTFLYLFYKNYKNISVIDNTKKLINNILKVRKTVKNYVYYNLATVFLVSIIINIVMFSDSDKLVKIMNPNNLSMSVNQIITVTIISQLVALIVILVLIWLFYRIVYGILLKKLNKNYKELAKLESLS